MKTRYGIVGAGYFGKEFGRILDAHPDCEVTAVFSPGDGKELALEHGAVNAESIDQLVELVDAVIISSPNHAHLEPVLKAAKNNVHVFCEKPVALNYEETSQMVAACEAAGVLFLAGHILHFMPGIIKLAELVQDGAIGEPIVGRAVRTGWEDGSQAPSWKKTKALSGGHLYHHIHELDLLQLFMGPAQTATMISGHAPQAGPRTGDDESILLATLTFPDNRYATLEWGSVFQRPQHSVTVQGTKGYFTVDMQNVSVTLHRPGQPVEQIPLHGSFEKDAKRASENAGVSSGSGVTYGDSSIRPPEWLRDAMISEIDYFQRLVSGQEAIGERWKSLTDGSAARASIATADALTLSAAEGRTIKIF